MVRTITAPAHRSAAPARATQFRWVRALCAATLLFTIGLPAAAQVTQTPPPPPTPAPRPADVASIDAIIGALYDVISGPAGQKRDWNRFHSLFIPNARLIPTGRTQQGEARHRVQTPEEYAASSGRSLEERGFFEKEIGRTTETFGNITHAFSAYDSRNTPDAQPFARGINSIQLLNDGKRWWIVTVFWDSERADNQIPAKYLNRGGR